MTKWTIPDDLVVFHKKRAENMHRRAQKAEGKYSRMWVFLDGASKSIKDDPSRWRELYRRLIYAMECARLGSGRGFSLQHDFMRRRVDEANARTKALETTITEALRARDEEIRDILRKGLHGETE